MKEPTLKKDSLRLNFGFALSEKEGETGLMATLANVALLEKASRFPGTSLSLGSLLGLRDFSSSHSS